MLPGIGQRSVKSNYRKCQTLKFRDGVPLPSLQEQTTSSSQLMTEDDDGDLYRFRPPHLIASRSVGCERDSLHMARELAGLCPAPHHNRPSALSLQKPFIPKNVLYDRMMLRFDGYYMEEDPTWGYSAGKKTFRPVKVVYYLEDDTIAIHEPVTPNAGRPQGKLVQRHKVLKTKSQQQLLSGDYGKNKNIVPTSANSLAVDLITESESLPTYWHWKDLNVGIDVIIFGRRYRLINCNAWTREFLTSAGIQVNAPEDLPESPHCSSGGGGELQETRSKSAPGRHQLKKFLEHDGHILRFGCVWDRRGEACVPPDERLKPYVLRYFLVDDTVQINDAEFESNQRRGLYGTNRAQEAVLLRRQKLPKEPRPILTSPADVVDVTFYDPSDFILGNAISVHGRRFILVETGDEFTRNFYRTMFDVVDFTPVQLEY